jgi:hypothetical protein
MKSKLAFSIVLAAGLAAPRAFPCGAPFGTGINVDPRQDIIVVHKNDVETYVFQPRFCGTASSFGLILPVPSKLSAEPALSKPGAFTLVDQLSKPVYRTVTTCDNGWRAGSAGGPPGGSNSNGGATLVSSGTVGFMDYSQLKADSVASFTDWLDANAYPYDALASSAFSYYVDKGWYFVTFKISQGTVAGSNTCKDLGPVKLSFPTTTPVVPTRMATARGRDTSGVLSNSSSFSWRIFGITEGSQQLGFAAGSTYNRVLGYSGLLADSALGDLDSLAQSGDRLDKLTISFNYGSTDPDISLTKVAATNYQEVITSYNYIACPDAAPVAIPDASPPIDSAAKLDAGVAPGPVVPRDAGQPDSATAIEPKEVHKGGGCSLSSVPVSASLIPLLTLALVVGILRRRR